MKLQFVVFAIVFLIIGIQTWLNIRNARQRNETKTQQQLSALYHQFNEEINLLERMAATLSLSFAHRPDIQERFQAKDRQGLLTLLKPVFTTLKTHYNIVHLQFHEPKGTIFLRIHNPKYYGDYTFTYRRANAFAIISRKTVAGVEIDPDRLGILGVSPVFHQGQFIGLVEVGLDYDQAFLKDLKMRQGGDYKMWVTYKDAAPAGLEQMNSALKPLSPELFFYAGTHLAALPVPTRVYQTVLQNGEPQVQFVSDNDQELAVLIAPMWGYGDRIIGILEISSSRTEALAALQRDQITTLSVAGGLALLALILMRISTNLVVLRPLRHLTTVAQRQLHGNLTARVTLLPGDEFGQLGHTLNVLTETLENTLKNQESIIAKRTDELTKTNEQLQQEIIEHKQAEEEMRRLRNVLSNIINSMPSVLIGVNSEGKVTQWNQEAEKTTGIPASEAQGCMLNTVFPRLTKSMQKIRQAILKREPYKEEKVGWKNDTEIRYSDITVYPLVANGVEGAVIRIDDVTERVRIEEVMIQTEKMMTVGGLAAGMAHEINNPLGIILQAIQNTFRRLSPQLEKNIQVAEECGIQLEQILNYLEKRHILSYLKGMRDAGQRAAKIVSNMLSFSRRNEADMVLTDLNQLLENMIELASKDYDLKKKYDFRHIEIIREYDSTLPTVFCLANEIEQVFLNLLRNAAQAIAEKQEEDYQPQIRIHTQKEEGYARIVIEDNGLGIDEESRTRVFEPFYTTKPVGIGTGLGLSVSYFIITTHHKGVMTVDSKSGIGAKFTIRLPL